MIIALRTSQNLAKNIAKAINTEIFYVDLKHFKHNELAVQENVDRQNVIVLFPNTNDVNSDLIVFLLMCRNLKNITAIIPYMPYARQDKSEAFKVIVRIIETVDLARIITLDIHSSKAMESFNIPIININSFDIFGSAFYRLFPTEQDRREVIIVAPDVGAIDRATFFAQQVGCEIVCIDKKNQNIRELQKVHGQKCLIIDDIISTGATINLAHDVLNANGALSVDVFVTHFQGSNFLHPKLGLIFIANNICHNDDRCIEIKWHNVFKNYLFS